MDYVLTSSDVLTLMLGYGLSVFAAYHVGRGVESEESRNRLVLQQAIEKEPDPRKKLLLELQLNDLDRDRKFRKYMRNLLLDKIREIDREQSGSEK